MIQKLHCTLLVVIACFTFIASPTLADNQGRVRIDYWTNITNGSLDYLTNQTLNPAYPDHPDAREYVADNMEIATNVFPQNFGSRIQGIFYPPTTGSYTFYVAGQSSFALYFNRLGTNAASAANVAGTNTYTNYHQWNKYPAQQTAGPYTLTNGFGYYIAAYQKSATTSTAHLSVAVKMPGSSTTNLLSAQYLAPYDPATSYVTNAGLVASTLTKSHPRLLVTQSSVTNLYKAVNVPGSVQSNWWYTIKQKVESDYLPTNKHVATPTGGNTLQRSRDLGNFVYYLGIYHLLVPGDTAASTRIHDELVLAETWNGGTRTNSQWDKDGFLAAAEITHAFAIGYDWCYNTWPSGWRGSISSDIDNMGLGLGIAYYNGTRLDANGVVRPGWWIHGDNNWTEVCDSAMILGALATLSDPDKGSNTNDTITLDQMLGPGGMPGSVAMQAWSPDGAWGESMDYWSFAIRYLSTAMSALETATGTTYQLDQTPGLDAAGFAPVYLVGPLNWGFNYGDESDDSFDTASYDVVPGCQYLGLKYNNPLYSWAQKNFINNYPTDRARYPTDLIWYDSRSNTPDGDGIPCSKYFSNAGIFALRNGWNNPNTLFAGLKGGYNTAGSTFGSNHEDLELGSFVLDAFGVRWIQDIGLLNGDDYSLPNYFQTSVSALPNRWQYYAKRAEGNNTLVLNPDGSGGQSQKGSASVIKWDANGRTAVIDMTSAYNKTDGMNTKGTSNVCAAIATTPFTSVKRGLRFESGGGYNCAQLQDEITASSGGYTLYSFMHLGPDVTYTYTPSNPTQITLTSGSNHLRLFLQSSTSSATFVTPMSATHLGSPQQPPAGTDDEAPSVIKLVIKNTGTMPSGLTRLTVTMVPYTTTEPTSSPLGTPAALSTW